MNQADSLPNERPSGGRIAGIDFGTKRIGVAITDRDQLLASPYENYNVRGPDQDAKWFREFVEREHVAHVLASTKGNKSRTASILGISRPRLDRLIKKYGLDEGIE